MAELVNPIGDFKMDLEDRIRKIKFILMDVDGTLTDGRIYCGRNGEAMKVFHTHDTGGIILANEIDIGIGWVSGRSSIIARVRANSLKIQCYYESVKNKDEIVYHVAEKFNLDLSEICFIGDDNNDIPAMKICGLSVAVNNAVEEVKDIAHYKTNANGGQGAVRELISYILNIQKESSKIKGTSEEEKSLRVF